MGKTKICKTCRKPIVNIMSNFCSTSCLLSWQAVKKEELRNEVMRSEYQ